VQSSMRELVCMNTPDVSFYNHAGDVGHVVHVKHKRSLKSFEVFQQLLNFQLQLCAHPALPKQPSPMLAT
jgi:hypothetical protein